MAWSARHAHVVYCSLLAPTAIGFLVFTTYFSWVGIAICLLSYCVRMFAITGFYHRYFSHRTYRMGRLYAVRSRSLGRHGDAKGGAVVGGSPQDSSQKSDTTDDPHNSREGFLHAHWLWFLYEESIETDMDQVPELARFPELRLIDRFWYVPPVAFGCALFILGGWHWVVWGYFVSTFLLSNATYTINSLMHYWGKQQYFTGDESRNHWLLALITLGEGWHNNHHRYQASTRNGFFRGEFDITYWGLKLFSICGLVSALTPVPDKILEEGRLNRYRQRRAIDAGRTFIPHRIQLSELLAEMPVKSKGLVAETLRRVREDMQSLRSEMVGQSANWRADLEELSAQINQCGVEIARDFSVGIPICVDGDREWQKGLQGIGDRCALLRADWLEMSESIAVEGKTLRCEVEMLGAKVSGRGRQLYVEVEALRWSLGKAAQRLAVEAESLHAQMAAPLQELQRDGLQIDLGRNYAEAVQRLHTEVDALCGLATEKKRQLGDEFEAWGSVLPRMA